MGLGGISPIQLLIILAIVILIFGTKKLKNLGGDVGSAVKSFKSAVSEDDKKDEPESLEKSESADANFSEVKSEEKSEEKQK